MRSKRGRDQSGKKKRWSKERKSKEKAKLYGKPALIAAKSKKLASKDLSQQQGSSKKSKLHKQEVVGAVAHPGELHHKVTRKKKRKRSKEQAKVVDEVGDVLVEHDFEDSDDEEEQEILAQEARRRQEEAEAAAKGKRQVIVFGIPWSADEVAIAAFFKSCGSIVEVTYPRDDKERPKGFAFVTFEDEQAVARALVLDGKDWQARKISVKIADKKGKRRGQHGGDDDDDDDEESQLNSDDDSSGSPCDFDSEDDEDEGSRRKGGKGGKGKGKGKGNGKGNGKHKGGKGAVKGKGKQPGAGKKGKKGKRRG